MTQPSVPFDLPPDDDEPKPQAPETDVRSDRRRSPPKGSETRGGMQETKREVPTNGAPKPPSKTVIDSANENWKNNPDAWPKNADALWPLIIGHLADSGVGPEAVVVHVSRNPIGPMVPDKDVVKLGTIRGDSIKPVGGMSASEAQHYYILNTFHCIPAPNGCGKAHYELEYRYAVTGAPIKTGTLELDSYSTLKAVAERANEIGAELGRSAQAEASGQPGRVAPIMPMPGQPQSFAAPAAGQSMPTEMAIQWGVMQERERLRAEQEKRPVREVPPPTGVPDNSAAIAWEREKATMQLAAAQATNTLELKIREMEMKFASDAAARKEEALLNRLAAMEHRMNNPAESDEAKMLKHLIALGIVQLGADGKPVPVGAGQAAAPATPLGPSVDDMLKDPAQFEKFEKARTEYRERIRRVHGFENPSTEIVKEEEEKKKDPTWFDKVLAVGGGILEGAVKNPEGPLTALAQFTKGSQAGAMFEGLASAAAAGKAAVNASRVTPPSSGGGGFKSSA